MVGLLWEVLKAREYPNAAAEKAIVPAPGFESPAPLSVTIIGPLLHVKSWQTAAMNEASALVLNPDKDTRGAKTSNNRLDLMVMCFLQCRFRCHAHRFFRLASIITQAQDVRKRQRALYVKLTKRLVQSPNATGYLTLPQTPLRALGTSSIAMKALGGNGLPRERAISAEKPKRG